MTIASLTSSRLGARSSDSVDGFVRFAQRYRQAWPAVGIVIATIVAYHFTLSSFFDFLSRDTPLAYLPLLPLFCIGIAIVTAKRYGTARKPIQDRQIDFLIGVPVIIVALALITIAPAIASAYYWTDRADVVSLALFAFGATTLAYGITWAWRLRASFVFLLLMWPALYLHLLSSVLQKFADWTNAALALLVVHLPFGVSLGAPGSGTVIVNPQHAAPVSIVISSACSGANSVLGFALIGGAILTTMGGGRGRKLLWWISGMALCFVFNLLRLLSIVGLSALGQSTFALGGYHAVIGLILFAIAVVVMLYALPLFGLHPRESVMDPSAAPRPAAPPPNLSEMVTQSVTTTSPMSVMSPPPAAPAVKAPKPRRVRRRVAIGLVCTFTAIVALADHGLQPYAAFEDGTGAPTVHPFGVNSAPSGWQIQQIAEYPWVTQYFGENATWFRYLVSRPGSTNVSYADVILTDDKGSLDTYSVQNCFLFHNYDVRTAERMDLGNGVVGLLLNYSDPSTNSRWATMSWAWPVNNKGETYYERINLTSSPVQGSGLQPGIARPGGLEQLLLDLLNGVSGGRNDPAAVPLFHNVDDNLEGEAYGLVGHAVKLAS